MSSTRKIGLELLKKATGTIPQGHISTSRYYPADKSWTKSPAWAFEIPLKKLNQKNDIKIHLVCLSVSEDFYYLRIPRSFFLKHLKNLFIRKNGRISLFLSARTKDNFLELRGVGKIDFSKWLLHTNIE